MGQCQGEEEQDLLDHGTVAVVGEDVALSAFYFPSASCFLTNIISYT